MIGCSVLCPPDSSRPACANVLRGNPSGVSVFDLRDSSLLCLIKGGEEVRGLDVSPDGCFISHAVPRSAQLWRLPG